MQPALKDEHSEHVKSVIDETKLTNKALNVNTMFINGVNITRHVAVKWWLRLVINERHTN